jgi:polyisoprenoid-binding protein YceI
MKSIILATVLVLSAWGRIEAQKTYKTNKGHVSFFAKAPVADVDARSNGAKIVLNASTGELTVNISMTSFQFQNKKMGRDARKRYLEIDKFPQAGFVGKINGEVDYDKPGTYPVKATGKLKIHGVEREINEKGSIKVEKGGITIGSQFSVALKDHNIDTPKILGQEMTAENVSVKIEATLTRASK